MTELETKFWVADVKIQQFIGETVWGKVLGRSGLEYLRLCDLPIVNGKGPRTSDGTVLPDFEAVGSGGRLFIDAKCKRHRAVFRKAGYERRHGIDHRYYEAYRQMSIKWRQHAYLGIVELFGDQGTREWSGRILAQSLEVLGEPVAREGAWKPGYANVVNWPAASFKCLGSMSPEELYGLCKVRGSCSPDLAAAFAVLVESHREVPLAVAR